MLCTSYIMFFFKEVDIVLYKTQIITYSHNKLLIYLITLCILSPLSLFSTIKNISIISFFAIVSIMLAATYLVITSMLDETNFEQRGDLKLVDFVGIKYFLGIAILLYEGNFVALDIY